MDVTNQETGYEIYKFSNVGLIWNIVYNHTIRKIHAPVKEIIIGITEDPKPRKEPTTTSMIPQRKYAGRALSAH